MSIFGLLVVIVLVGVLLWAVQRLIPMPPQVRQILTVVVVVLLIVWILQAFGLLSGNVLRVR